MAVAGFGRSGVDMIYWASCTAGWRPTPENRQRAESVLLAVGWPGPKKEDFKSNGVYRRPNFFALENLNLLRDELLIGL